MQSLRHKGARWLARTGGAAGLVLSLGAVTIAAPAVAGPAPLWIQQLGGTSFDNFEAVATDSAGNVVAVGRFGNADPWVVKFNAAGVVLWQKKPGPANLNRADGVAIDASNNIIVSTTTLYPYDKWLIKYNAAGTLLWTQKFGTGFNDEFRVAVDRLGNIYAAGGTSSSIYANSDVILVKYSQSGAPLWSKRYGSDEYDDCNGVANDKNGNVVLVGTTRGSFGGPNPSNLGRDAWVAKLDPTGKILWQQQLDSLDADSDYGNAVAVDSNGNVVVGGLTQGRFKTTSARGSKAWLAKYTTAGTLSWIEEYSPVGRDPDIRGLAVDGADRITTTGRSDWGHPADGAYVAKFGRAGALLWDSFITSGDWDSAQAAAVDRSGNAYVAGYTTGDLGSTNKGRDDAFLAKFPLR